ncbi:MAG: ABC transporter permease [Chloroflexota bacterium]|nr:ABC transporter permease [Chloroflexota bacterium]
MRGPTSSLLDGAIRTLSFSAKEIVSVVQQPLLVASLVLGPFVILLAFGLGYRGPQPVLWTILVAPDDAALIADLSVIAEGFSGVFELQRVTQDEASARAALLDGTADVVAIVPESIYSQLYRGEQPRLRVLYREADPTASGWVRYFTQVQTGELNRKIFVDILTQAEGPIDRALEDIDRAQDELDALEAALRREDVGEALERIDRLNALVQAIPAGLDSALTDAENGGGPSGTVPAPGDSLSAARADLQGADVVAALDRVRETRARLDRLEEVARRIDSIPVEQLVAPLTTEVVNLIPFEPTTVIFYTPAVLALIVQHVGLPLSAMSAVRDRRLGIFELFRVSPIGAAEILLGKALGYGVLLAIISTALTWLVVHFLGVPLQGSIGWYALSMAATIFASIALGFALAVVADTESQVVQLAMLVLLASVFVGGLFLPIELLASWLRSAAYALPATLGAIDLRAVMLYGEAPDTRFLLAPFGLGALLYAVALVGLHRRLRRA